MTRALAVEQREKIVAAHEAGLGTAKEIAKMFAVTVRSVYRYLRRQRETGSLEPDPTPGRPAILNDNNLSLIKEIILENTDGTLEEYRCKFLDKTGINVTIVTIHKACCLLDFRRKKSLLRSGTRKRGRTNKAKRLHCSNRGY